MATEFGEKLNIQSIKSVGPVIYIDMSCIIILREIPNSQRFVLVNNVTI